MPRETLRELREMINGVKDIHSRTQLHRWCDDHIFSLGYTNTLSHVALRSWSSARLDEVRVRNMEEAARVIGLEAVKGFSCTDIHRDLRNQDEIMSNEVYVIGRKK